MLWTGHALQHQFIYAACLIGALFISKILDYHILLPFTTALYVASLILMGLVRTPLGHSSHGASRWLYIGPINFQPAELAKIAVIIMMAYMIGKMGRKVKTLKSCMILGLPGAGLALAAYILTDNLSTAMIILGITVGMVFVAHPDMRPFIAVAAAGVILIVIRRCRHCMPLAPEGFLAAGLEIVSRSLEVFRKHKMI